MTQKYDCIIIGGGAAGLICAGKAAENGKNILVIEKNKILGRKLLITGKGRCNVTNNVENEKFFQNIVNNKSFLYSSVSNFTPENLINLLNNLGVELKTERGNRVFPVSDKSVDIVNALKKYCKLNNVHFLTGISVKKILTDNQQVIGITTNNYDELLADNIVVATGGLSYPLTGSTGDGYIFGKDLGHNLIKTSASLVPIILKEKDICKNLQGLTLKNVGLKIIRDKKIIYQDFGEMIFTDDGISGPIVLSASFFVEKDDIASIDLKYALNEDVLDKRLISDFNKYTNKNFINALSDLLPASLIPVFAERSGINNNLKVNQITKQMRMDLILLFKNFTFNVLDKKPIEEAVITSGGIDVKQINPKNMMSKIVENLFFVGEVLDVDAFTGGFNLQIAFSTGYAAGKYIGEKYIE